MGPTATGKTEMAMELADAFPLALINADSAQVYRGMDVGTAKPGPEVRRDYPHALMDFRDPAEPFSAGEFARAARTVAEEAFAAHRVPLLVGGTGLYFRAFAEGLADLPASDPAVRHRLQAEAEVQGWPALHRRLAETDPEAAARIHERDGQRILRALEVLEVTGRPLTDLQAEQGVAPITYPILRTALWLPREAIWERIEARFQQMLQAGLVAEAEALRAAGVPADSPALRAVGYRQALDYLNGRIDHDQLAEAGVVATRRLARRQLIWLRKTPDVTWFRADLEDERRALKERVEGFLGKHGWL
ncbi:tRNA (adenosine(37)-N6)-dimethylallyltransferase MiaA [Thiohalorhabdus sp.]|uniref:tRNA (adenosine(37)-N6)-dimethylallyltransferase MiaA n=1 Tax=Thiohalorhabdus sp. TaxID=3094134 RepID=UPI003FCD5736